MSSRIEGRLSRELSILAAETAPSVVVQAHHRGRLVCDWRFGDNYKYYDWASLTKIVFGASAAMSACERKLFHPDDLISKSLPWFREIPLRHSRVRDLLTHSAGLTWWKPFYKNLRATGSPEERWLRLEKAVERDVRKTTRPKIKKSTYSDLDFFLLGRILREVESAPLSDLWTQLNDRLELEETGFHRLNRPSHARRWYAPTEKCDWRNKVLQGEVHDENTWALGGVSIHAGLFGPPDDLAKWGLALRASLMSDKPSQKVQGHRGFVSRAVAKKFVSRAVPARVGDWGLGFMIPSLKNSSTGSYFSRRSFGHLGFTGTSFWFDPTRDLQVIILSNRVNPTRENRKIAQLRPRIHNIIVEELQLNLRPEAPLIWSQKEQNQNSARRG